MDKKILELLIEMNTELKNLKLDMNNLRSEMNTGFKSVRSEMNTEFKSVRSEVNTEFLSMKSDTSEFKSEMHNRFDKVDAKLEGIGGQFELTNESRIDDFDFIADKVNKLEKELYIIKSKNHN